MQSNIFFPKWFFLFVSFLFPLVTPVVSFGAAFCVSNPTELQAALTTAESNGEDNTIQIVQGTYNGNFTYASTEGNSLTVKGGYTGGCASRTIDPENTVLDGGGTDTALVLASQAATAFSVEGLTIRNGSTFTGANGGGLYAKTPNGTITLTNNIFIGNIASNRGGGAAVVGHDSTLTNNTFTGNTGNGGGGGGVWVIGNDSPSTPANNTTLTNNTFTENTGGGAMIQGNGNILTNNTFTGNTGNGGGGADVVGHDSTLTNNTFTGNIASSWYGGGAAVFGEGKTLTNNTFTGNTAETYGGGAAVVGHDSTLTNNTFTGNTAGDVGGGVSFRSYGRNVTLINNTITSNTAETEGGGVWLDLSGSNDIGNLYNNIIWNNTAPKGDDLYIDNRAKLYFPATVNLFNNVFDMSSSGTYIAEPFTIDPSNNNSNPLFLSGSDCHLVASSPCINSGDNNAPDLPSADKDGNPRIMGGTVDMGAYEYVDTPIPDIKANDQDGPITVSTSDPVSIDISLDPGGKTGQNADWWIAVNTPFAFPLNWYTYVYPTGWQSGINLYTQSKLLVLSPYEVLNMILPVGNYIFYFAIDDPDGAATGPWWGLDSVEVIVQ
jgi:parallel beta-helix repeat protein